MLCWDETAAIERRGDMWNALTFHRSPADDENGLALGINQIAWM